MSKYNIYMYCDCICEIEDYDKALQAYNDCVKEDPDATIDLFEVDDNGNLIYIIGIN